MTSLMRPLYCWHFLTIPRLSILGIVGLVNNIASKRSVCNSFEHFFYSFLWAKNGRFPHSIFSSITISTMHIKVAQIGDFRAHFGTFSAIFAYTRKKSPAQPKPGEASPEEIPSHEKMANYKPRSLSVLRMASAMRFSARYSMSTSSSRARNIIGCWLPLPSPTMRPCFAAQASASAA